MKELRVQNENTNFTGPLDYHKDQNRVTLTVTLNKYKGAPFVYTLDVVQRGLGKF